MKNLISFPRLGLEFNVSRVAFSVFGIEVYWYGLIISFGLVLAFLYACREAKKTSVSTDDLLNLFLMCVPAAIIGARLYYVLFNFSDYKNNLTEIFNIRGGGLAVYGGIIASSAVILIYCKAKKISCGGLFDILAIGLLIGQCIGRWGNFVNGEAFGGKTDCIFAMSIAADGKTVANGVHPTFFYESMWNFAGIFLLSLYKRKKLFNGEIFAAYMVWYGFGRMLIEGLRADSLYVGAFKVSQLLSAVLLICGIIVIVFGRKKSKLYKKFEKTEDKNL